MPRKDTNTGPISAQAQQDLVSEGIENFELPKSLVTKIAKSAIPENTKLQKETVLSLVKGSTVFINYLAATAHDVALSKQHKSISASDVLRALEMIEFGDIVDKLQGELQVYREQAKVDKSKKGSANINSSTSAAAKTKSSSASASTSAPGTKSKGKEKGKSASHALPPPFTSTPLSHSQAMGSTSTGAGAPMDVDGVTTEGEGDGLLEDLEHEEDPEVEAEALEEEELEEEDEVMAEEELQDNVAVEEEELQKDARGLDGHGPAPNEEASMDD